MISSEPSSMQELKAKNAHWRFIAGSELRKRYGTLSTEIAQVGKEGFYYRPPTLGGKGVVHNSNLAKFISWADAEKGFF